MFRKDLDAVLSRNIAFTTNPDQKGALLHILNIAGMEELPVKPLEQWRFPEDRIEYLEACIARDRLRWQQREGLQDDTIPTMKPFYGIAIHSAFLGGKVEFGGNTSFHLAPLTDYDQMDSLTLSEDNVFFRLLLDSMHYLKKRSREEGFLPSLRGADGPMDIANALRGNAFFEDLYEEEDNLHQLLALCAKAGQWTFDHQLEIIDPIEGGWITGQAIWLPGRSVGHISEDASALCSAQIYREFGKPYTEAFLAPYDSTICHVHTKGRHALKDIASIEKIRFIQLEYDMKEPAPIQVYKDNIGILENKIVVPIMTTEEIEENLEFLSQHKSIVQLYATSMEDALRATELIRSIS